jgi:hypothetical protein
VPASDDLGLDAATAARIEHADAGGFPIVFVVDDLATYDFSKPPVQGLGSYNAEAFAEPERLLRSLRHHGGLELFEGTGGVAFVSYARADGTEIAESIRGALRDAGLFGSMDVYDFPGGELIQREIRDRIERAVITVLVDTKRAEMSRWVADEVEMSVIARVPTLVVSPRSGSGHAVTTPHFTWDAADPDGSAGAVVRLARRILGSRMAFSARVHRTLARLARLRQWRAPTRATPISTLHTHVADLAIALTPERPEIDDVLRVTQHLSQGQRGMLVAGVRPVPRTKSAALAVASGRRVCVTHLGKVASAVPGRLADRPLQDVRLFPSAAAPSDPNEQMLAETTLYPFVVSLTQALLDLGGTLVFGGHPSITPLVHKAIEDLDGAPGRVELHQARLWQDSTVLPAEVREGPVFKYVQWHGDAEAKMDANLDDLRSAMISDSLTAAVFVGGKTEGYIGPRAGIVDEHERFKSLGGHRKTYILGLAGGAARKLPRSDGLLDRFLRTTSDPDLAAALIVADLLGV